MTASVRSGPHRQSALAPLLPREHGFWVMLGAVVTTSVFRSELSAEMLVVAGCMVVLAVALGSAFRLVIRRREGLQLASAAALSLAGVPIEWVGKVAPLSIASTTLAWAVVFVASALSVRATFAQASRTRRSRAAGLTFGSVAVPLLAAGLFAAAGFTAQTVAALLAAAGAAALGVLRPGVKRMKAVGLSLAGVAAAAAFALSVI